MAKTDFPLSITINAVDRATATLKRVQDQFNKTFKINKLEKLSKNLELMGKAAGFAKISKGLNGVGDSLGRLGTTAAKTTAGVAAGAVGMAIAFNQVFIGTAAKFEKFQTILETLEGSSEGAKKSMAWVSDFAAKTPYEIDEVTDSFVKLRAYGMEPQKGLLKTLGDTAAAMGKPLNMAVEAIADAVTGENERLKEFGIKARKAGNTITYEYTVAGKTMTKKAKANSREMIQATLEGIFNSKYAGSMDKLSRTWGGMVSNIGDQWTRFINMIMAAGPFDWLKAKLAGVLDTINKMAASGELERIANMIGVQIVTALEKLYQVATNDLIPAFKEVWGWLQSLRDIFGSWKFLIYAVVAVLAAPLITALAGATVAFATLGAVMLTTPLGWIALAIAGVVTAGVLLGNAINNLIDGFNKFGLIKGVLQPVFAFILDNLNPLGLLIKGLAKVAEFAGFKGASKYTLSNLVGIGAGAPVASGAPVNSGAATGLMQGSTNTNNAAVTVDFNNLPAGTRVTSAGNAPLNLNLGQRMGY